MMQHWAAEYIGQPWTNDTRCYDWFRRISREQFGRDLPPVIVDPIAGYKPTNNPQEGAAAILSGFGPGPARHIGMVIFPGANGTKKMILHACQGAGVVASDMTSLRANNLKILGFWAYEDTF